MRLWHDPGYALVEDDAGHKLRGSLGGEDYRMGVGTPLHAPADGVIRARNGGTGGYTLSLNPDGYPDIAAIEAMHCSSFAGLSMGGPSRRVVEGELVGWSGGAKGAPGAGSSTGPHCHEHVDLAGGGRTGLGLYIAANGLQANSVAALTPEQLDEREIEMGTPDVLRGQQNWAGWLNAGINGRLDTQVLPLLRLLAERSLEAGEDLDELIEATKVPFFQIAPSGRGAAIDEVAGYVRTYSSYDDWQDDVRVGTVSGKVNLVSEADFYERIARATARREERTEAAAVVIGAVVEPLHE